MSLLSKAVKSVAAPVKKVASVAVNTAAGFAAGGNVGALAGTARGIYENTKTGKAETINLRTIGQAAATGGVANIAAGAIAKGGALLAGKIGAGAPGIGLGEKLLNFGKSGGITGNLPSIFSGLGKGIAAGANVFGAIKNFATGQGQTPGTDEGLAATVGDQTSLANKIRSGYKTAIGSPPIREGIESISNKLLENTGTGGNFNKLKDIVRDRIVPNPETSPNNAPLVIQGPGGSGFDASSLIPVALIIGAAYFFLVKRHA